jgi:hypothetical protein
MRRLAIPAFIGFGTQRFAARRRLCEPISLLSTALIGVRSQTIRVTEWRYCSSIVTLPLARS